LQVNLAPAELALQGTASGAARISGTYSEPKASGSAVVVSAGIWNQPVDRAEGEFDWSPDTAGIRNGRIRIAGETTEISGSLDPQGVRWQAKSAGLSIERLEAIHNVRPGATGRAAFDLRGTGSYRDGKFALTAADGDIGLRQIALDGKVLGDASVAGVTRGTWLELSLQSSLLNAELSGSGRVQLEPGYATSADVQVSQLSLAFVRDWVSPPEKDGFRFDGSAAGKVSVQGPALDPKQWSASIELSELAVSPLTAKAGQFTIRNEGPVTASLKKGLLQIGAAKFSGPSTGFDLAGTLVLDPKDAPSGNTLDLGVNGGIGLALLKEFEPDLIATGGAALRIGVRGTLAKPVVEGRADLRQASFHFADVATGISNTNATILFSGGRATIEALTAETGGGKMSATGYLGLEGGVPAFRLQVNANQVRVRYPEGTSTVFDAVLSLTGTTRSSLLSGDVTVLRSGFGAQSDFSSLLSKSSGPVRTPSSRTGALSGLQFDVRVRSGANLSFDSSLARDLQADADLRLRGTPYNPLLLGRIVITQGEILFFGTRYTISQGTISFINPVKLEPILNLDVETRVRGIDVILTFTGPVNKLNVTHRADPPLEFSEVIALLATGRAPSSDPSLLALQSSQPQSINRLGAGDILGQAIANPVSSRLQRFFGVSKLKIDPKLSGVETTPQARLTLEQQVSRNLTFTYITDLTRSNQQIVRVEWNVNREWSVLATREENGVFGMDFLYKKSFK
jgi:translocation and assembly module TamB